MPVTARYARPPAAGRRLPLAMLLPAVLATAAPASADQGPTSAYLVDRDSDRRALRLLAQPPFPPTDLSLLSTVAYPDGPPMEPAPPREITAEELVKQLKATLKPRGHRAVEKGLAVFRSQQIAALVPDSNLRAALASLAGSPAQASIQTIRDGSFRLRLATFGATPNPDAIAQVVLTPDEQDRDIVFNQRYRYEDFRLLGVVFSHETLHSDRLLNANEELIASTLNNAYYGQLILKQPHLDASTELSRRLNTALMAHLNTRDARGRR
ncbi:hypothetical protein ACFU5O_36440 [Streptomyces sp. NPDC057445]|uniref:hypothetical protein n=1 Tax=Streptomyces sp. NPDC057445 TaxID=3346136 RepID=UPI0036932479